MNLDHRQTPFGPGHAERGNPIVNSPRVVLALIGVFTLIHFIRPFLSIADQNWILASFAFSPARYALPANLQGFVFPGGWAGDIWTFVSHMFLHGDWTHLIVNCVWMLIFGSVVARRLGTWPFMAFSAVCAAMGAAANLMSYWGEAPILIGASGAISGQMAGAVRMMFAGSGRMSELNRPEVFSRPVLTLVQTLSNRRAVTFIMVWMAANLIFGVVGVGVSNDETRIAWEAHLGGFLAGLLMFSWFDRRTVR